MYDCNLIKSRAQKMQDNQLPFLQPEAPATPINPNEPFQTPMPQPAPSGPSALPESEITVPISPLPAQPAPTSPTISVPSNPLLPPEYRTTLAYESLQYLNGFLRTQIGKYVEVEFLVGTSDRVTRTGRLIGMGLNYILLLDVETQDIVACDFYNIKFVKFFYRSTSSAIL